jgi:hypothetical protein
MTPKSIHNNRFMSPTIYKFIVENDEKLRKGTISIERHNITINKSSKEKHLRSNNSQNKNIVDNSFSEIKLASNIFEEVQGLVKKPTNDNIRVYIYLLDYPKNLDISKENITSAECNSGSTTFYLADECVEVVIWRGEEWTKVLYHELIHAFYIEYVLRINRDAEIRLKSLLPHYNNTIREAYTEILATLLETNRTHSDIRDQCLFLGTQVNKIAFYMFSPREELVVLERDTVANLDDKDGIEYISDFFTNPRNILDTSTNTGSYYILKSIYLWCGVYKDSDLLLVSKMLDKEFININFYTVILEALESGEYVKWLKSIYFKPTNKSLRLTAII